MPVKRGEAEVVLRLVLAVQERTHVHTRELCEVEAQHGSGKTWSRDIIT